MIKEITFQVALLFHSLINKNRLLLKSSYIIVGKQMYFCIFFLFIGVYIEMVMKVKV